MKKSSTAFSFFVMPAWCMVLSAQMAFASDAPAIAPVQLDFEARQVPKNCNDRATFASFLTEWGGDKVLIPDADRRLLVRIRRSPTGETLAEVTLLNAAGTTGDQEQKTFARNTECYKVLYGSARIAARLLGAFEKPSPHPPCPTCPPPPAPTRCPVCPTCPTCPAPMLPSPRMTLPEPFTRRAFIGAGVFLGMTLNAEAFAGPAISLGFVPFSRWPSLQIEFDGAYTSRKSQQGFRVDTVPLFASLCYAHDGIRLCGGMTSTLFSIEDPKNAHDFMLTASLRIGTELNIAGPFSIRADAFALLPLTQRIEFDTQKPFAAGAVVMGVWSIE